MCMRPLRHRGEKFPLTEQRFETVWHMLLPHLKIRIFFIAQRNLEIGCTENLEQPSDLQCE